MFVRAVPGPGGGALIEVGGLARSDTSGGFEDEFVTLAGELASVYQGREATGSFEDAEPDSAAGDNPRAPDDLTEGE
jgi:hypothetical protein